MLELGEGKYKGWMSGYGLIMLSRTMVVLRL